MDFVIAYIHSVSAQCGRSIKLLSQDVNEKNWIFNYIVNRGDETSWLSLMPTRNNPPWCKEQGIRGKDIGFVATLISYSTLQGTTQSVVKI